MFPSVALLWATSLASQAGAMSLPGCCTPVSYTHLDVYKRQIRYNERTAAERSNARLKDEFGGQTLRVKGDTKVMAHLMFGILALSADQLMRLRQ